jgi:hypothetical protein
MFNRPVDVHTARFYQLHPAWSGRCRDRAFLAFDEDHGADGITRRQKPANALVLVAVPSRRARMGPTRGEARWGRYTNRPRSAAITLNLPAPARDSVCQRIMTPCRLSISTSVGLAEPCPKTRIRHRPADRSDTLTERYRHGRGQEWTRSVTRRRPRYRLP